jgi:hypothetical protein
MYDIRIYIGVLLKLIITGVIRIYTGVLLKLIITGVIRIYTGVFLEYEARIIML